MSQSLYFLDALGPHHAESLGFFARASSHKKSQHALTPLLKTPTVITNPAVVENYKTEPRGAEFLRKNDAADKTGEWTINVLFWNAPPKSQVSSIKIRTRKKMKGNLRLTVHWTAHILYASLIFFLNVYQLKLHNFLQLTLWNNDARWNNSQITRDQGSRSAKPKKKMLREGGGKT